MFIRSGGDVSAANGKWYLLDVANYGGTSFLRLSGVDGGTYVRKIKVTANNFPDYVFEKNYNLLDIKELEKYI